MIKTTTAKYDFTLLPIIYPHLFGQEYILGPKLHKLLLLDQFSSDYVNLMNECSFFQLKGNQIIIFHVRCWHYILFWVCFFLRLKIKLNIYQLCSNEYNNNNYSIQNMTSSRSSACKQNDRQSPTSSSRSSLKQRQAALRLKPSSS